MTNEHPKYPLGKKRKYPIIIRKASIFVNDWHIKIDYMVSKFEDSSEFVKLCGISADNAWIFEDIHNLGLEPRRHLSGKNKDFEDNGFPISIIDVIKDKMLVSMRNIEHKNQFRILTAFDS
jgi:hypothetical protein